MLSWGPHARAKIGYGSTARRRSGAFESGACSVHRSPDQSSGPSWGPTPSRRVRRDPSGYLPTWPTRCFRGGEGRLADFVTCQREGGLPRRRAAGTCGTPGPVFRGDSRRRVPRHRGSRAGGGQGGLSADTCCRSPRRRGSDGVVRYGGTLLPGTALFLNNPFPGRALLDAGARCTGLAYHPGSCSANPCHSC
jgi:hypothetical protein